MGSNVKYPPMLEHYRSLKREYPDGLLFYRMGDFYELFFEDAEIAAPIMEVTLTARHKGTAYEAPMCGVPYHSLNSYVSKVLKAGYKAVICDQVEDPKKSRGLVRREVVRILTPGTLTDIDLDSANDSNYLAVIGRYDNLFFLIRCDAATGDIYIKSSLTLDELKDILDITLPSEALLLESLNSLEQWLSRRGVCITYPSKSWLLDKDLAASKVKDSFGVVSLKAVIEDEHHGLVIGLAALILYLEDTQRASISYLKFPKMDSSNNYVVVDYTTLRNLEIFQSLVGRRGKTLLEVLDFTKTAIGGRLLRNWLRFPSRDLKEIGERLDCVEFFYSEHLLRNEIRDRMRIASDVERIFTRVSLHRATPKDLLSLAETFDIVFQLFDRLPDFFLRRFKLERIEKGNDLKDYIFSKIVSDASYVESGYFIREGVNEELDRLRKVAKDARSVVKDFETRERERTGISSLKVRYNRMLGFYIEVTKPNLHLVPEEYIRKQTLSNAERFVTPELKKIEEEILYAEEKAKRIEMTIFDEIVVKVGEYKETIEEAAKFIAQLDCFTAFAEAAVRNNYVRPEVGEYSDFVIVGGRHPVVEKLSDTFIPNDLHFSKDERIAILTGPNMGGKSTYLRQVALITLMAHLGSFIPAKRAKIPLIDRIFTRVGAGDNLSGGESTFLVEMLETATILKHSTDKSLVILDEVGRGTSTYDGISIAWAIVEYLHSGKEGVPFVLFATHYHELTKLGKKLPKAFNLHVKVEEKEKEIVFLHKIERGESDKSYGIYVASLAGIPSEVINRAYEILEDIERELSVRVVSSNGNEWKRVKMRKLPFTKTTEEVVVQIIDKLDINSLTPLAALNILAVLKDRIYGK